VGMGEGILDHGGHGGCGWHGGVRGGWTRAFPGRLGHPCSPWSTV